MPEEEEISRIIELNEDLIEDNDKLAERNNELLKKNNITSFDIVGAIGAGKTALLEKITEKISKKYRILVICGDITTRVDASRIEKHNVDTVQINTGRECALNAYHIYQVLNNKNLDDYDLIIFDTAPTGHTLRFLSLPETLSGWIGKLIKMRIKIGNMFGAVKRLFTREEKKKDNSLEVLERLNDLSKLGFRALLAATLACLMTAAVAWRVFHKGIDITWIVMILENLSYKCQK